MVGLNTISSAIKLLNVASATTKPLVDTANEIANQAAGSRDNGQTNLSGLSSEEYATKLYSGFQKAVKGALEAATTNPLTQSLKEGAPLSQALNFAKNPEKLVSDVDSAWKDLNAIVAARLATKTSTETIQSPKEKARLEAEAKAQESGSPVIDLNKVITEGIDNRINGSSFRQIKDATQIKDILDKGLFVGDNYVQHGHLKMHDFTSLKIVGNSNNKVFGESNLSAQDLTKASATIGFLTKDAKELDAVMKGTQEALKEGLKDSGLEKDGKALSMLFANFAIKQADGKTGFDAKDFNFKDSKGVQMLKDAVALNNNPDLKNVAADKRSDTAARFNLGEYSKYAQLAFNKTDGPTDEQTKREEAHGKAFEDLGISREKMDQFSGSAYFRGVEDFAKLSDPKYIAQVKAEIAKNPNNAALNISLGVGSNFADASGVYADASRGQDMAALSQLGDDRGGFKADSLNQLAIVAHGEEGMNAALDKIQEFQKATGAQINLDLGVYGHANGAGDMFLGKDSGTDAGTRLTASDADGLMNKVQSITGESGSANITTWGCHTDKLADSLANTEASNKIGNLTVTGTKQLAESSSSNLASNDTIATVKKDEKGQLMTENITTNGHGNDTHQVTKATEAYKAEFNTKNGAELSSQQFNEAAVAQAQKDGLKISEAQGSDRAEPGQGPKDNKDGDGAIEEPALKAGDVAQAKQEQAKEKEDSASSENS